MTNKPTTADMPMPWRVSCSRRKIVQKTDGYEINPIMAVTIEYDRNGSGNPPFAFIVDKGKAARIVRCVNSHDALVEALESMLNVYGSNGGANRIAIAALQLAKGE